MKSFLNKKGSFFDKIAIKIIIIEFLKMYLYWLFLLLLLGIIGYCFVGYHTNTLITIIIVPLILSIFVSLIFLFINILIKRIRWAYKRTCIYRDLLEIFSIIIVSMHRDFGNILEPPMFRGYLSLNDADKRLLELYNFAKEKKQFDTKNYDLHNLKQLITQMSNEYFSIITTSCTDSDLVFIYSVLVTNCIKYKDDIEQLRNPVFNDIACGNAYLQIINITQEISIIYNKIYSIVIKETGGKMEEKSYGINYYKEKVFGGINDDSEKQIEKKALEQAWKTRDFEINLYWKRAGYFWAFNTTIAVAFYNVATNKGLTYMNEIAAILLILGVICSIAWFFSNIASKYWQENWENHINLLEDSECGRLYKTTMSYYEHPFKPSVSRLNLKISFFVILAWLVTAYICYSHSIKFWVALVISASIFCIKEIKSHTDFWNIVQLLFFNKSGKKTYMSSRTVDDTTIVEK